MIQKKQLVYIVIQTIRLIVPILKKIGIDRVEEIYDIVFSRLFDWSVDPTFKQSDFYSAILIIIKNIKQEKKTFYNENLERICGWCEQIGKYL